MKKQRYIVEIEMPDGDFISAGWLKDLIQTDCDVEDESRKKVTVQETSLPSNLDEAAEKVEDYYDVGEEHGYLYCHRGDIKDAFKAGAEWMAGQGVSIPGKVGIYGVDVESITKELWETGFKIGEEVILQIRKKQ